MERLIAKLVRNDAIDLISEELLMIEESAMLSNGVVNPSPDLLLREMHFTTVDSVLHTTVS